jgi:hypothetical protein
MLSLAYLADSARYLGQEIWASLPSLSASPSPSNESSSPYDSFGPSVRSNLNLLCPRLTSADPSHRLSTLLALQVAFFCFADRQISPGNAHPCHAYDRRIYVYALRISLGL